MWTEENSGAAKGNEIQIHILHVWRHTTQIDVKKHGSDQVMNKNQQHYSHMKWIRWEMDVKWQRVNEKYDWINFIVAFVVAAALLVLVFLFSTIKLIHYKHITNETKRNKADAQTHTHTWKPSSCNTMHSCCWCNVINFY